MKQPPVWTIILTCVLVASVTGIISILGGNINLESVLGTATVAKPASNDLYEVKKVIDGDTVDIIVKGETKRLRIIGINTPETVDPRRPVQCFGKEASNKMKELLENKKVKIEGDSAADDIDKYGRLLRYVWLEDGTFVNEKLIREGYAYEYTFEGRAYKYQKLFKDAQKDAENNKRGLWNPDTCNGRK